MYSISAFPQRSFPEGAWPDRAWPTDYDSGWSPPKKDYSPRTNYKLAQLNKEDDDILTIIMAWVLKNG